MNKEMFFAQPNQKGKYHVFNKEKRSLCGRWAMPFFKPVDDDFVTGNEIENTDDCKKCFKKSKEQ